MPFGAALRHQLGQAQEGGASPPEVLVQGELPKRVLMERFRAGAEGRVAIPGFYDAVKEWDPRARGAIRDLPFDEATFRAEVDRCTPYNGQFGPGLVIVMTAEDDTVAPARDLESISLADILDAIRHETPNPRRPNPRSLPLAGTSGNK